MDGQSYSNYYVSNGKKYPNYFILNEVFSEEDFQSISVNLAANQTSNHLKSNSSNSFYADAFALVLWP